MPAPIKIKGKPISKLRVLDTLPTGDYLIELESPSGYAYKTTIDSVVLSGLTNIPANSISAISLIDNTVTSEKIVDGTIRFNDLSPDVINAIAGGAPIGIPSGGLPGSVLTKLSEADYDSEWAILDVYTKIETYSKVEVDAALLNKADITDLPTELVPTGGTTGQVLKKNSDVDNDVIWSDLGVPTDVYTKEQVDIIISDVYTSITALQLLLVDADNALSGRIDAVEDLILVIDGQAYTNSLDITDLNTRVFATENDVAVLNNNYNSVSSSLSTVQTTLTNKADLGIDGRVLPEQLPEITASGNVELDDIVSLDGTSDITDWANKPVTRNFATSFSVPSTIANLKDFIQQVFFPSVAPTISFSINSGVFERGINQTFTLSLTGNTKDGTVTGGNFRLNSSNIATINPVLATNTNVSQSTTSVANGTSLVPSYSVSVNITEGTSPVVITRTPTFVDPHYKAALTLAEINNIITNGASYLSLTSGKVVSSISNAQQISFDFPVTAKRYVWLYPASRSAVTAITDQNNFTLSVSTDFIQGTFSYLRPDTTTITYRIIYNSLDITSTAVNTRYTYTTS